MNRDGHAELNTTGNRLVGNTIDVITLRTRVRYHRSDYSVEYLFCLGRMNTLVVSILYVAVQGTARSFSCLHIFGAARKT